MTDDRAPESIWTLAPAAAATAFWHGVSAWMDRGHPPLPLTPPETPPKGESVVSSPPPASRDPSPAARRHRTPPRVAGPPSWEYALGCGHHDTAVARFILEVYGRRWSTWVPVETLAKRISRTALRFADAYGVDPALCAENAHAVRVCERIIRTCWLAYLSHVRLGRPEHAWRLGPESQWYVGEEEGIRQLAERRQWLSRKASRPRRRAVTDETRGRIVTMRRTGRSYRAIAEETGVSRTTVARVLQADSA